MSAITSLQRGSIDRAAITFECAFSPDPMFTWVFPDPATRPAALQSLFRVPLEYGLRYGRVTTSHDAKAACVWVPPGPGITIPGMIRSGMLGVPFRTGFGPFGKFMTANETMDKIHKARVPEPHWYLVVVGVDPELQRPRRRFGNRSRGPRARRSRIKALLPRDERTSQSRVL